MQKENLKLYRGDDHLFKLRLEDSDGQAVDLTDCRLILHAKDSKGEIVLELASDENQGIALIPQADGGFEVLLYIGSTLTQGRSWESAEYDLQLIDSGGLRTTVLKGRITLEKDITQA